MYMYVCAFLGRMYIDMCVYECTILWPSYGIYDIHMLLLADAQGVGNREKTNE